MLGLLCPECSIVKTSPPPALGPRVCIRVFFVSFSLVKNLYFYTVMSTFVLHTLMCLKSIGRPFTVENLPLKKRNILLGPCLDNMTAG